MTPRTAGGASLDGSPDISTDALVTAIFQQASVGVASCASDGRFRLVNDRFCALLGRTREDLLTRTMMEVTHPEDVPRNLRLFENALRSGGSFAIDKRYVRGDGSDVWVHNAVSVVRHEGSVQCVAIVQELTQRRRAEEALRAQQNLTRLIVENTASAFFMMDRHGVPVYINAAAVEQTGYTLAELSSRPLHDSIHRPRDARAPPSDECAIQQAWRERRLLKDHEDVFYRKDGTAYDVVCSLMPLDGAQDAPGAVLEVRDVTAERRAQAELKAARRQLAVSEKMSALGSLVSGVAHEVRTPLAAIANHSELMRRRIDARLRAATSPDEQEFLRSLAPLLEGVGSAADRANRLVGDLRRFTRLDVARPIRTDLRPGVAAALDLFRATRRAQVRVEADLRPTGDLWVDPSQVQQVALNLLLNAAEATTGAEAVVRIRTAPHGAHALLEVEDNGPGIPPEVQARMWEPLFTTKPEGTGLGLSIVRRIVEERGGTIECESALGKGARFRVLLPLAT